MLGACREGDRREAHDAGAPGRSWRVRFDARPWTTNGERKRSRHERAELVRVWRQAFAVLARAQRIPRLDRVELVVTPFLRSRRGLQDVAGCHPAAKRSRG